MTSHVDFSIYIFTFSLLFEPILVLIVPTAMRFTAIALLLVFVRK